MADVAEVLFSSDSTGGITAWDPRAGTVLQSYRGCGAASRTLCLLGRDYLLAAEPGKSLLRAWPLNRHEQSQLRMVSPNGPVGALACSPCGNFIAGGVGGDVALWQAATGLQVSVLSGHFQKVTCVVFTDDSSLLASAAEDGHVRVHRFAAAVSGRPSELWTFQDHGAAIRDLAVGRGGLNSLLASAAADRTCRIYSLASGQLLLSLTADCSMTAAALALDRIYLGLSNGQIRGHRLANGPTDPCLCLSGHEAAITCLTVSLDGRLLASGGHDGRLLLWDTPSGQMLRSLTHRGPVTAAMLVLAPRNLLAADLRPQCVLQAFRRPLADDEEAIVRVLVSRKREEPDVGEELVEARNRGAADGEVAKINKQLVQFCVKNVLQPQKEMAKT